MKKLALRLTSLAKELVAEVGDVEIIEPVDEKPVKTRRTKKVDARGHIARRLLVLANDLMAADEEPEPGSTANLLDKMADEDEKSEPKVAATSDEEFIADQLNNAWEVTPEREMVDHLAKETKYSKSALRRVVKKWYDDSQLRRKMELARTTVWIDWLEKELS